MNALKCPQFYVNFVTALLVLVVSVLFSNHLSTEVHNSMIAVFVYDVLFTGATLLIFSGYRLSRQKEDIKRQAATISYWIAVWRGPRKKGGQEALEQKEVVELVHIFKGKVLLELLALETEVDEAISDAKRNLAKHKLWMLIEEYVKLENGYVYNLDTDTDVIYGQANITRRKDPSCVYTLPSKDKS